MMDRRDFIRKAAAGSAAVAVGGTAVLEGCSGGNQGRKNVNGLSSSLRMSFEPYELQLRHVFTVSSYSRKTTPGVQVRIDYQGITGYGEASMPPYLGQSVETVTAFLRKVDLTRFSHPFCLEDILGYVD